ncbi:unnamed protein product [Aureobasidium vineae]|uniref:DUF7730 domain-containing protein n=1 Tax=Aureobasidium vineae TaxID=2773715 RepID=A0A9N8JQK0_9PEZI|nr:unnamed protein product [Aureobasidium vineae]
MQPEPDENEKFPFLDLPAEIRNMIYSLVLERPGYRIHLSGKHSGVINTSWFGKNTYISRRDNPYSTSLMRVNKQINVESSPYLFSRHTFEFADSTMLQRFLEYLGPERITSLISVSVQQQYAVSAKQAYQLLSPAVSLAKLEINLWRGTAQYLDWSSILLPLFQSLCSDGCKTREEAYGIVTMPGADKVYCQTHRWSSAEGCDKRSKTYDAFHKKLHDGIEKGLDEAEAKKEAIKRGSPIKTRSGRKTKAVDYSGMEE